MTLLGTGVLAIWNGIESGADPEFLEWHVLEHIPERVAVPGFLRGRRYVAEGQVDPKYFNFYETESPEVLTSAAYRERLDSPTPWTRKVVSRFRDTTRTVCGVQASLGCGDGGWIETVRLAPSGDSAAFAIALSERILPALLGRRGIVAVHLLKGDPDASRGGSAEKGLRAQPDRIASWILLVEGVDSSSLEAARGAAAGDDELLELGAARGIERGIYRLQFALSKAEFAQGPGPAPHRWTKSS